MPLQNHLQLPEENSKEKERLERLLEGQASSLRNKFHDYLKSRYDKESEWESAIKQYEGEWEPADLEKIERALSMEKSAISPISVNITRSKTNIAIAKMKDIQFPTGGDFNFFLKPAPLTPVQKAMLNQQKPDPQMELAAAERGVDPGQLPAPAQMVQEQVASNTDRAPKMERLLRNRMVNAEYGRKARQAIEDLCIKGTAVVKGPTIQDKKYRRYESATASDGTEVQVLREEFMPEPSVERVDPLYFFPDPSARYPHEVEDCFELHPMSASELIELLKNPAFIKENIKKVLSSDPDPSHVPDIVARTTQEKSNASQHKRYWVREYHGPLDKQVLRDAEMIDEEQFEDPTVRFTGEVWYCNREVIRMSLSHIEGEDQLPYGISVWERDPNSVFGHGCPFLLKNAQRVTNQAYLMLLDNASLTAGPQIVLNREMIEPANKGDYGIEPMKVWFMTEYGANVQEAMQFINIPAQMEGIAQIMDTAMQFADMESSTPLIQQGEMPSGNNTTTGMAMIMSATNIIQKAASMNWDDYITKPLVQRFYHYEMQYGDDPEVKGDFEVEVGGATVRIEAQIRAQEIERILGLAGSNEEFMMNVDANKAFRALADNTRTGDILRTVQEVEQMKQEQAAAAQQQAEQNPDIIKAQAAMLTAQSRQQEAQARAQLDNAKQQMAAMEVQARYQGQIAEAQARNNQAQLEYQARLAQIASDREINMAQLQKDLQLADIDYTKQLDLKEIDFAKMEREIEVKAEYGTGI
jgi:hypothetical protein